MKTRHQFQLGLAAIEFVLVLPVLLILAFSIIDFGRLLFQYDALTKSTRDATKYVARAVKPAANALATEIAAYQAPGPPHRASTPPAPWKQTPHRR